MSSLRVCVITGSRADYGLLLPVMQALRDDPAFQLQVLVTGMHLAPQFGLTWRTIEEDGFAVDARVDMLVSSDSAVGNAKSVGLGVIGFADAFERLKPELVLLLGDRFEIFAAAQAALLGRYPIAHIAGGDVTEGAFDEALRHGISKMAHLHFVTNSDAGRRLRQLGEDPAHIHVVGSPALDLLRQTALVDRSDLETVLNFRFRQKNLLVTFHPATLECGSAASQAEELLAALDLLGENFGLIFTQSNADTGGFAIAALINRFATEHANARVYASLGQLHYYSLMAHVDAVVGNSSSGLYEAPSLKVPTVNVGDRQKGRLKAASVIDCPTQRDAITGAIHAALSLDCRNAVNPYGDGHATERIMAVLRGLREPQRLLKKHFHDWGR